MENVMGVEYFCFQMYVDYCFIQSHKGSSTHCCVRSCVCLVICLCESDIKLSHPSILLLYIIVSKQTHNISCCCSSTSRSPLCSLSRLPGVWWPSYSENSPNLIIIRTNTRPSGIASVIKSGRTKTSDIILVHHFLLTLPKSNTWIPWKLSFRYILFHEKKNTPNNAVTPQCQSQFTPKMKANAVPRLLSSLVWIVQYNEI